MIQITESSIASSSQTEDEAYVFVFLNVESTAIHNVASTRKVGYSSPFRSVDTRKENTKNNRFIPRCAQSSTILPEDSLQVKDPAPSSYVDMRSVPSRPALRNRLQVGHNMARAHDLF